MPLAVCYCIGTSVGAAVQVFIIRHSLQIVGQCTNGNRLQDHVLTV